MQELEEIYIDLIRKVYEKFTFFIPMAVAENENMVGIFHYMNVKLDDEFYDKYVDILLFCDDNMEVHEFISYKEFMEFNGAKTLNLSSNCAKLANLKDTIGKTSFRYIFEKYTEQLVVLNYACDRLVQFFYEHYPENQLDITFLFRQQKLLLQTHINEIEKVIISKGKRIDEIIIMQRLFEMFLSLPDVKTTVSNDNSVEKEQNKGLFNRDIDQINPENSRKEKELKKIKPLRDYIKHNNKIEIERVVKEHFSDLRGKGLRFLIEYFVEKKILTLEDKKGLRESFIQLFDGADVAHFNSIFGAKVFSSGDQFYKNKKEVFDEIFNTVFQQSKENPQ